MRGTVKPARRGRPLVMLAILATAWIGGRAAVWENPFGLPPAGLSPLLAEGKVSPNRAANAMSEAGAARPGALAFADAGTMDRHADDPVRHFALLTRSAPVFGSTGRIAGSNPFIIQPRVATAHQLMLAAAILQLPSPASFRQAASLLSASGQPPFLPPIAPVPTPVRKPHRWSLDSWAFWRQGSNSTAISQGRVPIYGASQLGANLQFRLAAESPNDLRAYARAYRALVTNGESEIALGLSARPFSRVPLRAYGEVRVTDNGVQTELRPAAMVVTELPPQRLPGGLVAEAYGQGGYVGGAGATGFVDGQVTLTGEVTGFDLANTRLSVGAGAWGGAQRDASRVDLGPTLRLDLSIGKVPARLSVDWREQVAGDAAPDSGVAATLSTRF